MAVWNVISAQTVDGSNPTSVTFASIPDTYDHLYILASTRLSNTASSNYHPEMVTSFNNVTTGTEYNYSAIKAYYSTITGIISRNQASGWYGLMSTGNNTVADIFAPTEIWIPNYSNTDNYKTGVFTCIASNNSTTDGEWYHQWGGFQWANTAAISEIDFIPTSSGTFAQYSTFTLYGINGAA
tara:strand:+ start:663 stop:1211 length:549 start_codon:yes stop_codon:yes gene_type:complete